MDNFDTQAANWPSQRLQSDRSAAEITRQLRSPITRTCLFRLGFPLCIDLKGDSKWPASDGS